MVHLRWPSRSEKYQSTPVKTIAIRITSGTYFRWVEAAAGLNDLAVSMADLPLLALGNSILQTAIEGAAIPKQGVLSWDKLVQSEADFAFSVAYSSGRS